MFYSKKTMNRLTHIFAILLGLLATNVWSQPTYKATLPAPDVTGFYKINLPYEVLGASRSDLADIRIKDEKGREVAWLLRKDEEHIFRNEFIPFPTEIQSGKYQTDVYIVADGKPVSSFIIHLKNADSDKKATLLGSYDRKTWYTVKEHLRLNDINNPYDTESFIELKFPLSDYACYKMSIKDSLSSPLNIIEAGYRQKESFLKQMQVEIPLVKSEIRIQEKRTDIKLVFPYRNRVSELAFYISAPQYFRRNIIFHSSLGTGVLTADHGKPLRVACDQYSDTLILSVNNGDDRPLTIDSIKAFTPGYYLIAGLEQGVNYTMTYGDGSASMPDYDLSFSLHISDNIAPLTPMNIEKLPLTLSEEPSVWMIYLKKYGVWTVILLIILQILYAVRRLLK